MLIPNDDAIIDNYQVEKQNAMQPIFVLHHTPHCPLGSVAGFLAEEEMVCRDFDLFADVPARLPLEESSGLIVLGGPMSANDTEEYPFLEPELDWIREAVEAQVPILGICLGAQLLAKALGKKVYPNRVPEIGWYEIEVLPSAAADRLFGTCDAAETVFQWHGDTFDLPPGAVHLALSRACRHQAFRFGRTAWGLQFHIEMTPAVIDTWLSEAENRRELAGLDYIDPRAIAAQTPQMMPAMQALGDRVLPRFVSLCG